MWNRPSSLIPRRQAEHDQFLTPYADALPTAQRGEAAIGVPLPSTPPGRRPIPRIGALPLPTGPAAVSSEPVVAAPRSPAPRLLTPADIPFETPTRIPRHSVKLILFAAILLGGALTASPCAASPVASVILPWGDAVVAVVQAATSVMLPLAIAAVTAAAARIAGPLRIFVTTALVERLVRNGPAITP